MSMLTLALITTKRFHSATGTGTLTKDGFSRVDLFNVQASTYKYDIISLCETLLYDEVEIPNPLTVK